MMLAQVKSTDVNETYLHDCTFTQLITCFAKYKCYYLTIVSVGGTCPFRSSCIARVNHTSSHQQNNNSKTCSATTPKDGPEPETDKDGH